MNWKKLLFPPAWLMILLTLISAAGLVVVFVKGWETAVIAYAIYVLSFYTLTVVTVFCALVLPKQYGKLKKSFLQIPLQTVMLQISFSAPRYR